MDQPASAIGLAFGLAIGAGAASALGAAAVFFTDHTNTRFLAGALSVSAGVMIYVSFVEIFTETIVNFEEAGYSPAEANRYSALCFFAGMFVVWLLDKLTHAIIHLVHHFSTRLQEALSPSHRGVAPTQQAVQQLAHMPAPASAHSNTSGTQHQQSGSHNVEPLRFRQAAHGLANTSQQPQAPSMECPSPSATLTPMPSCTDLASSTHVATATVDLEMHDTASMGKKLHHTAYGRPLAGQSGAPELRRPSTVPSEPAAQEEVVQAILEADTAGNNGLSRLGLLAALAIGLHNLPEGMATFVGTLADRSTGVVIAFAIAMHNIPEGIVVAMSIYFATGSKWKSFFWGVLLSLTEPLGALLAYCILLGQEVDPLVFAIMFGLVGGMMVCISLVELLPKALKYDPDDTISSKGLVLGMVIMAASLLLFDI